MRILLAEDDRIISQGLIAALRKAGYGVDHVNNGADADTALLSQPYDLLILDLGLPRLSGIDVLKRLRGAQSRPCRCWCSRRRMASKTGCADSMPAPTIT
jgi:two-component system OmpR family response regulator